MSSEARLRRFLLVATLVVLAGTIVELLLMEHTESAAQFIPFGLCAAGLVVVVARLASSARWTLVALRAVMTLVALGGVVGTWLHVDNNIAFEREMRPGAPLADVWWDAIHGASPLLAPGIMLLTAALAIASTYRER
jgi:hypothetical protein